MKDIETTKKLAIQYFEGRISRNDEAELFRFIDSNDGNRKMFRLWEDDWAGNHVIGESTGKAWKNLQAQINEEKSHTPYHNIFLRNNRHWFTFAAAAVVGLFVLASIWLAFSLNNQKDVGAFLCDVPYGSRMKMTLPDSTVVWLNSGSTLKYSSEFNDNNRRVELDGEAYFEVAKRGGKEFTVGTRGYEVVVKGTKFNVTAYSEDDVVSTMLLEGSVEIFRKNERLKMQPGEVVAYDTKSEKFLKAKTSRNVLSWINEDTDFDSISLGDLAKILERKYDVSIHIESESLKKEKISISLRNKESMDDVMEALAKVLVMKVSHKGREVYIR
ncbi:MAG: FecR family protein [Prevotella sp.]|nr:FecR family protein [Prevotella sp.]